MARKPRLQFPGAIYHVYSRGNYRKALFTDPGSGEAFESALFQAAECSNWLLHAYAIMPNHYHAVIETPDGNLSSGMQWLQGTFANRFNRRRGEHGHAFQGRYNSPLVETGEHLRRVVDYVHLNFVRAGLLSLSQLRHQGLSSYRRFWQAELPPRLVRRGFLNALSLPDNLHSMQAYENWLCNREEGNPDMEQDLKNEFHRTWAIGSIEFQRAIQERFARSAPAQDWGGPELKELMKGNWENLVRAELRLRQMSEMDLFISPKLATWKIEISRLLRSQTNASNRWIAQRLHMGHPSNISKYRWIMPKSKGRPPASVWEI